MTHEQHHGGGGAPHLTADLEIALVGSPNAGKTTLFNSLTGLRFKTANYPGVTVSRGEGFIHVDGREIVLVDLPGTFGLSAISPDEQVVVDALGGGLGRRPDGLVVAVDATALERSLLFVAELLQLDVPTAIALTMVDEVEARGGTVDVERLSAALGVPVMPVVGHRGIGVAALRTMLAHPEEWATPALPPPATGAERAAWVDSVVRSATTRPGPDRRTHRIDAVVLHPVAGVAVFLAVMLVFFQSIFTFAAPALDAIDSSFGALADQVRDLVPGTLGEFLADGVIAGVGAVLVFLPQIILLFLILALLEKVGYLARAAFLADRLLSRFGLEGRSMVAMLSSFACAIPGILATRTIPSERRRLATMMAAPLMTCSARLPVYVLLISAFVSDRTVLGPFTAQGLTMFGLYALGAVSGLVYAAVLSHTVLAGPTAPFAMELPPYRRPTLRSVLLATWDGTWSFVRRAGTVILVTSMALWVLLSIPSVTPPEGLTEAQAAQYEMEQSLAGRVGSALEPVFAPLGFDWSTNVAIIGSLAAREVFVSTLAITTASESEDALPDRLQTMEDADGNLVYDSATVAAILVFFVYALQCLSTVAVLRRETNSWRWPVFAFGSMFALAYVGALIARTVVLAVT
ncbi:MAG: ferrous iron transporter B [Acidimicrobiales bacterium]|nr:ferrous iron transporter B [Acidimicrobiales bacterium]